MKKIRIALLALLSIFLVSCQDNLLVKAVPTPEGKTLVDSVYDSIVSIKTVSNDPVSFKEFVYDAVVDKKDQTPETEMFISEILDAVFTKEKAEKTMIPGFSLTLLKGFDIGDFDRLAGLHTRADIAYLNEKVGSVAKEGEDYTLVLTEYYNFLKDLMGGGIEGVINLQDDAVLKIADVITLRLATRLIFNTMITAIYNEVKDMDTVEFDAYLARLQEQPGELIYIIMSKTVIEDVLDSYSILNKLKGSTTIIDIGFLAETEGEATV